MVANKKKISLLLSLLAIALALSPLYRDNVEATTQAVSETEKDGMVKENGKWVYYKDGKLDTTYTGMAKNEYGMWYIKKGKLDTTFSGTIKHMGVTYAIKSGKVVK